MLHSLEAKIGQIWIRCKSDLIVSPGENLRSFALISLFCEFRLAGAFGNLSGQISSGLWVGHFDA